MKRIIKILFTVILVSIATAVLFACNGKSGGNGSTEDTTEFSVEEKVTLNIEDSYVLSVVGLSDGDSVTFTSADPSIATVDATGRITGVSLGKTTVMAKNENGDRAYCTVNVTQVLLHAENYELDRSEITVFRTFTYKLTGVLTKNGEEIDTSEGTETFTSLDESVATVSDDGTVKGVGFGETTIVSELSINGKIMRAECLVTVVDGVILEYDEKQVTVDSRNAVTPALRLFRIEKTDLGEITEQDLSIDNIKYSSSDGSFAKVNDSGRIVGVNPGDAVVTAVSEEYGLCAEIAVRINAVPTGYLTRFDEDATSMSIETLASLEGRGSGTSMFHTEWFGKKGVMTYARQGGTGWESVVLYTVWEGEYDVTGDEVICLSMRMMSYLSNPIWNGIFLIANDANKDDYRTAGYKFGEELGIDGDWTRRGYGYERWDTIEVTPAQLHLSAGEKLTKLRIAVNINGHAAYGRGTGGQPDLYIGNYQPMFALDEIYIRDNVFVLDIKNESDVPVKFSVGGVEYTSDYPMTICGDPFEISVGNGYSADVSGANFDVSLGKWVPSGDVTISVGNNRGIEMDFDEKTGFERDDTRLWNNSAPYQKWDAEKYGENGVITFGMTTSYGWQSFHEYKIYEGVYEIRTGDSFVTRLRMMAAEKNPIWGVFIRATYIRDGAVYTNGDSGALGYYAGLPEWNSWKHGYEEWATIRYSCEDMGLQSGDVLVKLEFIIEVNGRDASSNGASGANSYVGELINLDRVSLETNGFDEAANVITSFTFESDPAAAGEFGNATPTVTWQASAYDESGVMALGLSSNNGFQERLTYTLWTGSKTVSSDDDVIRIHIRGMSASGNPVCDDCSIMVNGTKYTIANYPGVGWNTYWEDRVGSEQWKWLEIGVSSFGLHAGDTITSFGVFLDISGSAMVSYGAASGAANYTGTIIFIDAVEFKVA